VNLPKPPPRLSAASRKLWRHIVEIYDMREDELAVLEEAVRALDRAAEAREHLRKDGLVLPGRFGPRAHPMQAVENSAALRGAKLLRQLGLGDAEIVAKAPSLGIA
jgi:phage terminase small subunit